PNKKPPKLAGLPRHPVNSAAKTQKAIDGNTAPPGHANFLSIHGNTRLMMAFPTVNMKKVNLKVIPTVWIKERLLPFPIKDKITENINRPVISLTMAEATIHMPILDLNISV